MQLQALYVYLYHQLYKAIIISSDSGYVGKGYFLINMDIKDKGVGEMKHLAL